MRGGLLAFLLALGGCAAAAPPPPPPPAISASDFATLRQVLARSPAARAELEQACARGPLAASAAERAATAAVLDVEVEEVERVLCERLVAAIARGDVDHADFQRLEAGSEDPAFLRRLVRALRQQPGQLRI
jgi:hypothetical protein